MKKEEFYKDKRPEFCGGIVVGRPRKQQERRHAENDVQEWLKTEWISDIENYGTSYSDPFHRRQENKRFMIESLRIDIPQNRNEVSCQCGCHKLFNINCIQFHHKNPDFKSFYWKSYGFWDVSELKDELPYLMVLSATCHRKLHFYTSKDEDLSSSSVQKRKYKRENIEYLLEKYGIEGCLNCDYSDINILQFHHVDPATKDISKSTRMGREKLSIVKDEIDKCIPLCPNCHQIHHSFMS